MAGRPKRLQVFAVEDTSIQLSWGDLPAQHLEVRAGDAHVALDHPGGPGTCDVGGLAPAARHAVEVRGDGWRCTLSATTLAPPPGDELYRLATVSDMHLGMDYFGFMCTMKEDPLPRGEVHTTRCTRAAFHEAAAWGAQHLVVKGDVTWHGQRPQWQEFAGLVDEVGLPADVIPGNHDVSTLRDLEPDEALQEIGVEPVDGVRAVDVPGLRILLLDTTTPERHAGHVRTTAERAVALAAASTTPVLVAGHHQVNALPIPHFWPPGIPSHRIERFLADLAAACPDVLYTAGHTHRHRRWQRKGVEIVEVGSPKDYPGTWAGYVVHEGGIRQVVRRVTVPDCLVWLEYSRWAALGAWGRWSPGRLRSRSFTLPWRASWPRTPGSEVGDALQERGHGLAGDRG